MAVDREFRDSLEKALNNVTRNITNESADVIDSKLTSTMQEIGKIMSTYDPEQISRKERGKTSEMTTGFSEDIIKSLAKKAEEAETETEAKKFDEMVKNITKSFNDMSENIQGNFKKTTPTIRSVIKSGFSDFVNSSVDVLKEKMGKLVGAISSTISDVMGPLGDAILGFKDMLLSPIFNFFKGKSDELKEAIKGNKYLKKIVNFFEEERKQEAREIETKGKKGWLAKTIGALVLLLGVTIGGFIRSITIPFELLGSALKPFFKFFGWLGKIVLKFPGMETLVKTGTKIVDKFRSFKKSFSGLSNFIGKISAFIGDIGKKVGGILTILKDKIPLLAKFIRGLKFGFKVLGLPITLLFGLIDFIKGFMNTEGTFFDKLKGGLWSVFEGLFGLPIKIIGGIVDWVLDKFGIKVEGSVGKLIMDKIKSVFDIYFNIIESIINWVKDKFSWIIGGDEKEDKIKSEQNLATNEFDTTNRTAAQRKAEAIRYQQRVREMREEKRQKEKDEKDKQNQINIVNSINNIRQQASPQEIPSETDNYILGLQTMGAG